MDAVKEDAQVVGVRVEDTEKRVKWKTDSLWREEDSSDVGALVNPKLTVATAASGLAPGGDPPSFQVRLQFQLL